MSDEVIETFTMPSSETDRKKIKERLHEMSGLLQVIKDKRDDIKAYAEVLEADFKIPKKISTKMARVLHANNYSDVSIEADNFTTIFESLFQVESVED